MPFNQANTKAGAKPIVEEFRIEGLYGYRTITLSSPYATSILIARNGAGKTTLLGALDAFLKGQFSRLSGIEFTFIICKLKDWPQPITISKADVEALTNHPPTDTFWQMAKQLSVSPAELQSFIEENSDFDKFPYGKSQLADKIYEMSGFTGSEVRKHLSRIKDSLLGRSHNIDRARDILKKVLNNTEIIYLPTFRRIELSLPDDDDNKKGTRRTSVKQKLGLTGNKLFGADIQFGLSDISERLAALNQDILLNSNEGYRQISANIINELLSGAFDQENHNASERPDSESLQLFFARLKDISIRRPYRDMVVIPDLDRIYSSQGISDQSNRFLTYFLNKLKTVMTATRDIESQVEEFIKNCNRYLSATDDSASLNMSEHDGDEKELELDRRTLQVRVKSLAVNREVPLDSLSSGEKQMISLFARLYLYTGNKIILIDEPELSLSLDWQKKILVDIVSAPTVTQVIAITHSPFVFDNELEPYARSLSIEIDKQKYESKLKGIEGSAEDE